MIKAIVFDLDGVLLDSEAVWEEVRRQVVAETGGHWKPDTQSRLMGMSTAEWANFLGTDLGVRLPPELIAHTVIERMAGRYRDHLPLMHGPPKRFADWPGCGRWEWPAHRRVP